MDDMNIEGPELSPEEIEALRTQMRDDAFNGTITKGWVWNEEAASYIPPFPPPDNKYPYLWNEGTLTWDHFPGYPRDDEAPQ
jgi:hypothetical protein